MSLSQLASALKELPEYREVMSKLGQHMHIAHDCMDKFNKLGLLDLSDVEQTLATGKDDDDKTVKLAETISRCESALIRIQDPDDRLRLMLIATISQGGLSSGDKDRLLRAAQLGRKELQTLESISKIAIGSINNNAASPAAAKEGRGGFLG
jgi:syntaxin-binding protein 1